MAEEIREIKINRDELYEEVWKIPLSRLAHQYQISDVGLAKVCRTLNVPRPPRGYWTKLEFRKRVRRPPLPRIKDESPFEYTHCVYTKPEAIAKIDPAVMEKISAEKEIKVPERLHSTHALVRETRSILKARTPDKYGMLSHYQEGCFGVRISRESVKRALRLLNALIKEFRSQGFLVSAKTGQKIETHLEIYGERIPFSLIEDARRIDHVLTEEERRQQKAGSSWSLPPWDFVPTGKLSLIIQAFGAVGVRKKWSDATRKHLEQKLGDFVKGAILVAYTLKQERAKREEENKKWEEEQKLREVEEKRRRAEEARLHDLEEQVAQWAKSQQLKAYIQAVEKEVAVRQFSEDSQKGIERWLSWAKDHADRLDPIKQGLK